MIPRFDSSRSCSWNDPRPHTNESLRRMKHGPIQSESKAPRAFEYALWFAMILGTAVLIAVGAG